MRVPAKEMAAEFERVLLGRGFNGELAALNARLFTENSVDGIYTHGLNRFPRTVEYIDKGWIKVNATPEKAGGGGSFEQWDGKQGIGPSNAKICMDRAVGLAREYGIGLVALRNTTHWMRGGAYGLQAANAGCIGVCFTNTVPNMPPWGAVENRVGNNPFIIALPREEGHVMLDMAMSQFSFGAIEKLAKEGKTLPVPGGFNTKGEITTDPAEIWETQRPLPIGFWKGSGMSVALDMMASVLSQGNSVSDLSRLPAEICISQIFIAIDAAGRVGNDMARRIEDTIRYIKAAEKTEGNGVIFFPNEMTYDTRRENLELGVPVDEDYWRMVKAY
jgi:3-dehydro-L-gulonate 2-dehydrogenase